MDAGKPIWNTIRHLSVRHGRLTLFGLVVVLVPLVVAWKSLDHARKTIQGAVKKISPGLEMLGGINISLIIFVAIILACWLIGLIVSRTVLGRRIFNWEKEKFLGRSPLMQKVVKKSAGESSTQESSSDDAQPALAHIAGGWQPGVIVDDQAEDWATIFVPEIPSVSTGRLYLVHKDQILRLDLPLDAFREQLTGSGHGSKDWLRALSEATTEAATEAVTDADDGPARNP